MTEKISKRVCFIISGCAFLFYVLYSLGIVMFSSSRVMRGLGILLSFFYMHNFIGIPMLIKAIYIISILLLSIMLLLKKNNLLTSISLALISFVRLYIFIGDIHIRNSYGTNIVALISIILITVISFIGIKKQNSKIFKIWYIPIILNIFYLFSIGTYCGFMSYILPFLFGQVIYCIAVAFFAYSFIASKESEDYKTISTENIPISQSQSYSPSIYGYCDMTKHVLLLIFLGCIWQYIWIYRTTDFLNKTPNQEKRDPLTKLLLCMFVPFYSIYWTYQSAKRIEILAKEKNIECDIITLSVVLSLFITIVPPIIMQNKLNQICKCEKQTTSVPEEKTVEQKAEAKVEINTDKTDEIRNYKKLLDDGIITEEEFEAKKKQLLGL